MTEPVAALSGTDDAIRLEGVSVHFAQRGGIADRMLGRLGPLRAVEHVDLSVRRGEILGIIGESGSGKTTLGRTMIGMQRPTAGRILLDGDDIAHIRPSALRRLRKRLQMVFQDPHAALNPTMTIGQALDHPVRIHFAGLSAPERRKRVEAALEKVDLVPVARFLTQHPRGLSGGQKQRAVIGRAIISSPDVVVADEPVSMLDTSVRAKVLQLLLDLKAEMGLTVVYVTHDLASARFICDRVAIMYLGRIVEIGSVEEIFTTPQHPYTRALLNAIPDVNPAAMRNQPAPPRGEIPDAAAPPMGCAFHPRCPVAFESCGWEPRDVRFVLEQRWSVVDPAVYERERNVIPPFSEHLIDGNKLVLMPRSGRSAAELLSTLEAIREDIADEPLFRGIRSMRIDSGKVVLDFAGGEVPDLLHSGRSSVACHAVRMPKTLTVPKKATK